MEVAIKKTNEILDAIGRENALGVLNGQWLAPVIVSHIKTLDSEFVCVKSSGVYATASRVETGEITYGDRSYPLVFYDRIYLTGIRIVAGCSGLMLIDRINYAEAQPDGSLRVYRNRIHESSLIPDVSSRIHFSSKRIAT